MIMTDKIKEGKKYILEMDCEEFARFSLYMGMAMGAFLKYGNRVEADKVEELQEKVKET